MCWILEYQHIPNMFIIRCYSAGASDLFVIGGQQQDKTVASLMSLIPHLIISIFPPPY